MQCFHVVAVAFIAFTLSLVTKSLSLPGCFGTTDKETEEFQPVFLKKDNTTYKFIIPTNGTLEFLHLDKIAIGCPDPKNALRNSNQNVSVGICRYGKIKVGDTLYDFNDLLCNKSIRGSIKATNKRCGNNEGFLTNIGYYIEKEFATLIEICYDPDKGNSLYSDHTIYGQSIKNASHSKLRPGFSTLGLGPNISASVAYKNAFQKSTFNKLLGSSALADLYINRKSYLSRGHLAPDADFLFASWQFTTYFYINTCPQWQVINGGNWQKIESMIRRVAGDLLRNLRVITGTYGVLKFPDLNGNLVELYMLGDQRLRVPKFVFKIVADESTETGIVIINLNNPYVSNVSESDYFCRSICEDYGWYDKNWGTFRKGIVHCCEYKEFVKTVNFVPQLKIRNVLKGPK